LHFAGCGKGVQRSLHRSLTPLKRKRQSRTRPGLTVCKETEHRRMFIFDGQSQHDDIPLTARRQYKSSPGRTYDSQRPKRSAKPSDFDS
jgi:hypothetical protein